MIQHWEPDARRIADCRCGGDLRLVEDPGRGLPVEAQCDTCGEMTGLPRDALVEQAIAPGSPEDLGF